MLEIHDVSEFCYCTEQNSTIEGNCVEIANVKSLDARANIPIILRFKSFQETKNDVYTSRAAWV